MDLMSLLKQAGTFMQDNPTIVPMALQAYGTYRAANAPSYDPGYAARTMQQGLMGMGNTMMQGSQIKNQRETQEMQRSLLQQKLAEAQRTNEARRRAKEYLIGPMSTPAGAGVPDQDAMLPDDASGGTARMGGALAAYPAAQRPLIEAAVEVSPETALLSMLKQSQQPLKAPTTREIKQGENIVTQEFIGGQWRDVGTSPRFQPRDDRAPTTREIKKGDQVVTQEFVGGEWREVGSGPRFNPAAGGPSLAQTANNEEISTARERIRALKDKLMPGESLRDYVLRASQKASDTGRNNPNYDPMLERDLRIATQRQVGNDPQYRAFLDALGIVVPEPPPAPVTPPTEGPSLMDRLQGAIRSTFGPSVPGNGTQPGGAPPPAYGDGGGLPKGIGPSRTFTGSAGQAPTTGTAPQQLPMVSQPGGAPRLDRSKLRLDMEYVLPDGRRVRFNGTDFDVVGQ